MNNVGNGLIIYVGAPLLCLASVHCHKQMRFTVQWLAECCFKHYFQFSGCGLDQKAVRCHSGFVPPRQSSGGTNSLADTFRRKEYASVHIPPG